jgi:hypothetical protein
MKTRLFAVLSLLGLAWSGFSYACPPAVSRAVVRTQVQCVPVQTIAVQPVTLLQMVPVQTVAVAAPPVVTTQTTTTTTRQQAVETLPAPVMAPQAVQQVQVAPMAVQTLETVAAPLVELAPVELVATSHLRRRAERRLQRLEARSIAATTITALPVTSIATFAASPCLSSAGRSRSVTRTRSSYR